MEASRETYVNGQAQVIPTRGLKCDYCGQALKRGEMQKYLGGTYHTRCALTKLSKPKVVEQYVEPDDYYDDTEGWDDEEAWQEEVRKDPDPPQALPAVGKLMSHRDTTLVTRDQLVYLPLPEDTPTFKPIAHSYLVDSVEEALDYRRISIVKSQFAVSEDGMKMFGLLEVNADYEGIRFAIGLRNANDKSMRLGMVAGYTVFVCDNMSFAGDFKPLLAKHTKNFDMVEAVSIGIDRIQRGWKPLQEAIRFKREFQLSQQYAQSLIYTAFMHNKFPITLMKTVHREMFVHPSYEEFAPQTMWSLENAFTTAFKQLHPLKQFGLTAKLGNFLQGQTDPF